MTEDDIRLQARLATIEYFVVSAIDMVYRLRGLSDAEVRALHAGLRTTARMRTIPGATPEQSDLYAAEIEAATERMLEGLEELWNADSKSLGQDDP